METPGIESTNKIEPVISIRGLYKSFEELHVLNDINLDLFKGENVAVLGRSGTGKSVLIKIIVGLLKPDKGTVTVLGKQINKLGINELNKLRLKLGFSFQHSALYDSMNVHENLAFPLRMNFGHKSKNEINRKIHEALDAVGLSEKIAQMPSELSGGQRKRVGIARTLILNPEIMLYDEPTSGLDPITSGEINELIREVQTRFKTSSIIITHDLACAKATGDRIAIMADGNFIKVGSFADVFESTDHRIKSFYNYNFVQ
jgi:phospholipid/cholesterol/gamma-HCH transport system ATP-binding protein